MGTDSTIEWTHHTFSPWWGCVKVSPGCANCYAEAFADGRFRMRLWGPSGTRRFFNDKKWREPLAWDRKAAAAKQRRRVFCASMADVFEDRPDLDLWRGKLWRLISETSNLDWLLLTKRPEEATRLWTMAAIAAQELDPKKDAPTWLSNVWLGTSVENQKAADERIPTLLRVHAGVRFLSCEPLLERVNLGSRLRDLDWVIVGGESGAKARPCAVAWIRDIVNQCNQAGVPVFVKQLGARPLVTTRWDMSEHIFRQADANGWTDHDTPAVVRLDHKKGGDPAEWPSDLRVRLFPTRATTPPSTCA